METGTTPDREGTAYMIETREAGCTTGDRMEIGKMARCTGYDRGPNYSDQDARGSRDSSVEHGGQINIASEQDERPNFS